MTRRRVLIAGCGDVGTALGIALAADGHRVWGLRRRPDGLPADIAPVAADLGRPDTLRDLPREIDALVYAAAADAFDEAAYRTAYVDGVRHVLAALAARGALLRRVLFVSSTAVYGQTAGEWVDETSATEPSGFSGRVMLEGEVAAGTAGGAGAAVAIVRLGGIYGPGRERLIEEVRAGRATLAPGAPQWTNRIHRDDAAGVLRHLLGVEHAAGVWIGVDHEPADRADVLRWLADRLGVPPPPVAPAERRSGRPRTNKRCVNAKLLAAGYRFRYPTYREGYAAVLESAIPVQNA